MRIQDLEIKTGLERATIRFYEREGLVSPQRAANGYREYTPQDAEDLLKIKLLRQLGLSLDQIRQIKQGSGDISAALDAQLPTLNDQIDTKRRASEVCQQMRAANVTYQSLDAPYYLDQLSRPSQSPLLTPPFQERLPKEHHPLRRFAARMLDFALMEAGALFLLFVLLRLRPLPTGKALSLVSYLLMLPTLPANALFLHLWGTTPGKWIMGIRLEHMEGGRLSFSQALHREWRVFWLGLGFYAPLISLWRMYRSAKIYSDTGVTPWDEDIELSYSDWGRKGKALLVSAWSLVLALLIAVALDSYMPRHRSHCLTPEQFSDNYNFYETYTFAGQTLRADGTWETLPPDSGLIYVGYNTQTPSEFTFHTQDNLLRRIDYHMDAELTFSTGQVLAEFRTAVYAAILSYDGISYQEKLAFDRQWAAIAAAPSGEVTIGGITIRWNTETENCENSDGVYCIIDESQPAYLTLDFEIIYN